MDKFLNRSREAELEPNQNNAFPEEISSSKKFLKISKFLVVKKKQKR